MVMTMKHDCLVMTPNLGSKTLPNHDQKKYIKCTAIPQWYQPFHTITQLMCIINML